jgi:hypothetical protein
MSLYELIRRDSILRGIIPFLGLRSTLKCLYGVNKQFRKRIRNYYLKLSERIENGRPVESSGRKLSNILDVSRLLCHSLGLTSISTTAEKLLEETDKISSLREAGLFEDVMKLNSCMYSYWNSTPDTPKSGVFEALNTGVDINEEIAHWKDSMMNDCQYWATSRVQGKFVILMERPDGTIVISEETKEVYLVLGLAQSIGEVILKSSRPSRWHKEGMHGPIVGVRVALTLLNWEDRIVYDGLIVADRAPVTAPVLRTYLQQYIHAMDTNRVHIQLSRVLMKGNPPSSSGKTTQSTNGARGMITTALKTAKKPLTRVPPMIVEGDEGEEEADVEVEESKEEIIETEYLRIQLQIPLEKLRHGKYGNLKEINQPLLFRRFGYSEMTNPHHLMGILCKGMMLHVLNTKQLIPTCQEYVYMVEEIMPIIGEKPISILIDTRSVLKCLGKLLTPIGINVIYYPPPSDEESSFREIFHSFASTVMNSIVVEHREEMGTVQDPPNCYVCGRYTCADGKRLLTCGKCGEMFYCSREHQKQHWPKHKKHCNK